MTRFRKVPNFRELVNSFEELWPSGSHFLRGGRRQSLADTKVLICSADQLF